MGFLENVRRLSRVLAEHKDEQFSERGTINAFVNPFLSLLGHDPSKPSQVVHEYTADIGTKRGEKVDIAVLRDGKPIILIECKKLNTRLGPDEISQLYRYFGTTDASIGILTNGLAYLFFSDTEKQNVMDRRPFFTFDILDFTDTQAGTLERFTRARFHESGILDTARFLKHAASVESRIAEELAGPSDAFVDFFARPVHQGRMTAEVRERFRDVLVAGIRQFVESGAGNMPQPDRDASGTASTRGRRPSSRPGGMADRTLMVFTRRSVQTMLAERGSRAWALSAERARHCTYIVCTRNRRHSEAGPDDREAAREEHGAAFLVGRISVVEPTPDRPGRYVVRFDEYAILDPQPVVWPGARNPVQYVDDIGELGIDPDKLNWTKEY